jgi:hypothetical protein
LRKLLALLLFFALGGAACSDREVVVTRDQYGGAWPLHVNSARVVCPSDGAGGALLKLGTKTYALDPLAESQGHPPAGRVAAFDPSVLRSACGQDPSHIAIRP